MLPTFDLSTVITAHNITKKKKVDAKNDFKYQYFNSEFLFLTNSIISHVNESHTLFRFTDSEEQHIQETKEYLLSLKSWLHAPHTMLQYPKKPVLPTMCQIKEKKQLYSWTNVWCERFNKKLFWQRVATSKEQKKDAEEEKQRWDRHCVFARSNVSGLSYIAIDLLPLLQKYHKRAEKALKFKWLSIPKSIYVAYKIYLKNFNKVAIEIEQQALYSMLERLQVFDNSLGQCNHVIKATVGRLIGKGLVSSMSVFPEGDEKFDAESFLAFHEYIQKYGNKDFREKLYGLSWYHDNAMLATKVIDSKGLNFLVSDVVAEYIPKKEKWPNWMFKKRNFRYRLMKENLYWIAMLKSVPQIIGVGLMLRNTKRLETLYEILNSKEKVAKKLLDQAEKIAISNRTNFFAKKHIDFARAWRDELSNYLLKILDKKLSLLEKLANIMIDKDQKGKTHAPNNDACQLIEKLMHDVKNNLPAEGSSMRERFDVIEKKILAAFSLKKASDILSSCISGSVISDGRLRYFVEYYQANKLANNADIVFITSAGKRGANKIFNNLMREMKKDISTLSESELSQHKIKVKNSYLMLSQFSDKQPIDRLSQQFERYFLMHIVSMAGYFESKNMQKIEVNMKYLPEVVRLLAGECSVADRRLSEIVDELLQLWQSKSTRIFYVKCDALSKMFQERNLVKYFDEDVTVFNENITNNFKKDSALKFSVNNVKSLFMLRNKMLDKNSFNTHDIEGNLTADETVLLKMNDSSGCSVSEMISMSAYIKLVQFQMHNEEIDYQQKCIIVDRAVNNIGAMLSKYCGDDKSHHLLSTASVMRTLFSA